MKANRFTCLSTLSAQLGTCHLTTYLVFFGNQIGRDYGVIPNLQVFILCCTQLRNVSLSDYCIGHFQKCKTVYYWNNVLLSLDILYTVNHRRQK